MILPTWLNHIEERFSYKKVQFKWSCPPVKTSCPTAEIYKCNRWPKERVSLIRKSHFQRGEERGRPWREIVGFKVSYYDNLIKNI